MSSALFVLGVLFLVLVAPLWIVAHYLVRWRAQRALTADDEKQLAELYELAGKMEARITNLEHVLAPDGVQPEAYR